MKTKEKDFGSLGNTASSDSQGPPSTADNRVTHTPGPWTIDRRASTYVTGPDGRGICSTGGYHDSRLDPDALIAENRANARLIAAAPELLERLREVVSLHDDPCPYDANTTMAVARALLSKFDGVQP